MCTYTCVGVLPIHDGLGPHCALWRHVSMHVSGGPLGLLIVSPADCSVLFCLKLANTEET